MSTFVVRVVDSSEGRLRGVVERISDQRHLPFSDSGQLLAFLTANDGADDAEETNSKTT
ncbi:MAG: hypothetical protein WCC60_02660 [Ilumatobacteraceae bacterium]